MTTREKLEKELAAIAKWRAARRKAEEADCRREHAIRLAIHKAALAELVGVAGAVRLRYRRPSGDRMARFNDQPGTIVAVARTRALIDFGGGERWHIPVEELARPGEIQGIRAIL